MASHDYGGDGNGVGEVRTADGVLVTVQRPHVIRERRIGCGICEYKCPVSGEAAIRVYVA